MGYSATLYVEAVKPADEKFTQMKAVWDACTAAGLDIPSEVEEYFNYLGPVADGVTTLLAKVDVVDGHMGEAPSGAVIRSIREQGDGHARYGFEIDTTKLSKDSTRIVVYVSGGWQENGSEEMTDIENAPLLYTIHGKLAGMNNGTEPVTWEEVPESIKRIWIGFAALAESILCSERDTEWMDACSSYVSRDCRYPLYEKMGVDRDGIHGV